MVYVVKHKHVVFYFFQSGTFKKKKKDEQMINLALSNSLNAVEH